MTYFYVYVIATLIVAVLFVCYPFIRLKYQSSSSKGSGQILELSNANVIKQRITELESEVNEGLIDPDEKENAIRDLKLALVAETPEVDTRAQKPLSVLLLIALALPALGIGAWVYWQSNQLPGLLAYKESTLQIDELRQKLDEQGPQSLTPNDFAQFALSLRSSLRDNPDDARAWSFWQWSILPLGELMRALPLIKRPLI